LKAFIVSSVMDKTQKCHNGSGGGVVSPNDKGQVSSSRLRQALFKGDMEYVSELLGRRHRLVMAVNDMWQVFNTEVSIPNSCLLNQPPVEGMYENCALFVNEVFIGSCQVVIGTEMVQIRSKDGVSVRNLMHDCEVLGVEFG
jgi:FAD synthetase